MVIIIFLVFYCSWDDSIFWDRISCKLTGSKEIESSSYKLDPYAAIIKICGVPMDPAYGPPENSLIISVFGYNFHEFSNATTSS